MFSTFWNQTEKIAIVKIKGPEASDFFDVMKTAPQFLCSDRLALEGLIAVIIRLIGRISNFQG